MIDLGRIAKQKRHRPIRASGGVITDAVIDGKRYKIHTFTSSGVFEVQDGGLVEYLVVAGGGAGGNSSGAPAGGGGGAGGLRIGSTVLSSLNQIVVTVGGPSENSSFGTFVSNAGGRGGNGIAGGSAVLRDGQAGGSGGGAGAGETGSGRGRAGAGNTPATNPSQGNAGGARAIDGSSNTLNFAAGGGGALTAGEVTNEIRHTSPGLGLTTNFSGELKTYASGGFAGSMQAGEPSTGNGGGGGANGFDGLPGGSGIVIVRYRFRYSKD
jgi:hypothetical protein